MTNEERAHKVLVGSDYIALATMGGDGRPWAVIVGKKAYESGKLTWVSMADTDHSKAIALNNNVAVTVWVGTETVKMHATAREVSCEESGLAQYEAIMTDAKYGAVDRTNHWLEIEKLMQIES